MLNDHFLSFQRFPNGEPLALFLLRRWSRNNDLDELCKPNNYGEPMSQVSNWRPIDRYGESLHSSEVVNARELKFCEGCGGLLVRLWGSNAQFCPDWMTPVATALRRMQ